MPSSAITAHYLPGHACHGGNHADGQRIIRGGVSGVVGTATPPPRVPQDVSAKPGVISPTESGSSAACVVGRRLGRARGWMGLGDVLVFPL